MKASVHPYGLTTDMMMCSCGSMGAMIMQDVTVLFDAH